MDGMGVGVWAVDVIDLKNDFSRSNHIKSSDFNQKQHKHFFSDLKFRNSYCLSQFCSCRPQPMLPMFQE